MKWIDRQKLLSCKESIKLLNLPLLRLSLQQLKNSICISNSKRFKESSLKNYFKLKEEKLFLLSNLGNPFLLLLQRQNTTIIKNSILGWRISITIDLNSQIMYFYKLETKETLWRNNLYWSYLKWLLLVSEDTIIDGLDWQNKSRFLWV